MSIQHLVRANIRRLKPYSSARHEFEGVADVYLDANENPYGDGLNRYPDPLQQAVKERLSELKGVPVSNLFLGNGSDEAIDLLIRIFCEPRQDHIIILPPTYGMYRVSADIADVGVVEINLKPGFQPDVPAILETADKHSKILFICSPNNPTGNDVDREAIRQLLAGFPGIVVIDEAYFDFSRQDSCITLLQEYPNLVVMQTFSKAWGLAGIRLGIAFASEEIIALFNKVKPPYNVNELTQRSALKSLEKPERQKEIIGEILNERDRIAGLLPSFDFVDRVFPSDANFLLVRVASPDDLYRYLVQLGIIVRNRSRVPMCEGALRITIGTRKENDRLLEALRNYENGTVK